MPSDRSTDWDRHNRRRRISRLDGLAVLEDRETVRIKATVPQCVSSSDAYWRLGGRSQICNATCLTSVRGVPAGGF